jgi:hypothetical protein
MLKKKPFWMITAGLLLGTTAAHAAGNGDDQFSLAAGADFSSGKYGTNTTTEIWSVPLTATYNMDRWTFKLVLPYVDISGAGNVIPGVGRVDNGNPRGRGHGRGAAAGTASATAGTTAGTGSASGLGDIVASAGYEVFQSSDRSFGVDLTGKVKFGTADANKGLGTGKNDYGASLDTYKVYGDWTAFGGVGWMKYGSSPYIQLKNGINATLGLGYKLSRDDDFGAYYYYRQKIAATGGVQSEVTAYWNHKLNQNLRVQAYVLGGLANGSPDYGVGASLKYLF